MRGVWVPSFVHDLQSMTMTMTTMLVVVAVVVEDVVVSCERRRWH